MPVYQQSLAFPTSARLAESGRDTTPKISVFIISWPTRNNRRIYWEYDTPTYPDIERACPNSAHKAIVELEKRGVVSAVITQNVDGLHQKAGTSPDKVFELHGTQREVGCLKCGRRWRREVVVERTERDGIDVPVL